MEKSSTEDKVIDTLIALFSIVFIFMTIYPFYYIIVVSFNEGVDASLGDFTGFRESLHWKITRISLMILNG